MKTLMLNVVIPDAETFGRYTATVDEEENEMENHDVSDEEVEEYETEMEYSSTPSQWNTEHFENLEMQLDVMMIALGVIAGLLFMRGIFE